jgi:pimeloyl-ACP methyl ester carboxylesterase
MARLGGYLRACALLVSGLQGLGVQAAPGGLSPCRLQGVEHEAMCGRVQRLLDPANERSARIDVHFAVLPALARNKTPDPVFFLAGGPGQSAIELAGPLSRMLARFGNRRDIVLVDQRGTGRSAALACDEDAPWLPLRESADAERQVQRAQACLRKLQALPHGDLRQYTTSIAVADLDAVRLALGAPPINLIGASYGTRVALEYMRQFPSAVRRAVLDGVVPPDMALPQASAMDAQAAFDALLRACEDDAVCRTRHPRARPAWQALLASLPRELTVSHPFGGHAEILTLTRDMLLGMVRAALYVPALAAALPAALDEAAQGRLAPLIGLSSAIGPARGRAALAQGMHFSVICAEDMPRQARALVEAADFGEGLAPLYRRVCKFWPRGVVPEGFKDLPVAPVATLLLSGGIDPATPPRHARRVAQALGAMARHEVVPNAGHGLLNLGCLRDLVFRFVDARTDAEALKLDASCAREIPRPPMFRPPGQGIAP